MLVKKNVFVSYLDSNDANKSLTGMIEQNGKDYLIISNPETGIWTLIPLKYINYIEFKEKINI